jgi:peptidoglycan/xylan/chitin deacetylase (PgdA/CDA1 family)
VLAQFQVTATFFMIGWEAAARPDLVRQVAAAGNGIGGHTWNHVDLTRENDAGFVNQVDRTDDLLGTLTGRRVTCVRPPKGHFNKAVATRLAARGVSTVLWSDDPGDWARPSTPRIVQRVLTGLKPNAIVELHDGGGDRSQTVEALPKIVEGIRAQGYDIAPICL